uniref:ATP synthase complex subunit 8 n=1 Tax=Nototriton abscondens TaxID=107968 RepID=Q644I7_9SALA|nr:ATP synthase F0 subunit 8 [Nototriton abscondens]
MPQLNPGPWFLIMLMSWFIYMIIMPKTQDMNMLNEPNMKNDKSNTQPWHWPWT